TETKLSRPRGRSLDRIRGAIDAEHAAGWPDHPCGEKSDVAGARTDIEDMHSIVDAGALEHLLGEVAPEGRLHRQSAQLRVGMAEDIWLSRYCVHGTSRLTGSPASPVRRSDAKWMMIKRRSRGQISARALPR